MCWKLSLGMLNLGCLGSLGTDFVLEDLVFCFLTTDLLFLSKSFFSFFFGPFFTFDLLRLEVFGTLEVFFCCTCLVRIFCFSLMFFRLGRPRFFFGKDWLFFCVSLSCIRFFSSATNCSRVKVAFSESFPCGRRATCSLTPWPCSWSQNLLSGCLYEILTDDKYNLVMEMSYNAK